MDDGADQGLVLGIDADVAHERLVDLELVHLEALEVAQRRIPRAEVVDGHAHAARMQVSHDLHGALGIVAGHPLGQLQLQAGRIDPRLAQHLADQAGQIRVPELHGRNVDGHGQRRQAGIPPARHLRHGRAQHPFADRNDQPGFFGKGNELGRRHHAPFGVLPADQGLDADDAVIAQAALGLVVQQQLPTFQRTAQCALQLQGACCLCLHVGGIEVVGVAPFLLGTVHGHVGMLREGLQVFAVLGIHGNAQRRRHHELMAAHHQGRRHRLEQLASQMGGAVLVGTRKHQHKLIAPHAGHGVLFTHLFMHAPRHSHQEFIAHAVPQRIVDVLEMVQIHEQHRQRLAGALGHADIVRKAVGQQGAVGQPGEQVEMRHPADALLVGLALAHVRENADVMRGLPLGVLDAADGEPLGIHLAVLAPIPDFALPQAVCLDVAPHLAVKTAVMPARGQYPGVAPGDLRQ